MKILATVISNGGAMGRRHLCRETWMRFLPAGAVEAFFVSGVPGAEGEDDVRALPAPDDYRHLPAKVLAAARLALSVGGWEWWAKVDDDVFFAGERAVELLDSVPAEFGAAVMERPGGAHREWSAGFCYFLRREVVQAVVQAHDAGLHCLPEEGLEDKAMHTAARAAGAALWGTARMSLREPPTPQNDIVAAHCIHPETMVDLAYNFTRNS